MKLEISELRDPARLMQEVTDRVRLADEDVYLVLIEDPSTTQRVLGVTRLRSPATIDDEDDVTEELRETVADLSIPGACRPPRHMVMTVLVRRGLCPIGPNECRWLYAWRYSHHLADIWDSQVIVVTEHGWCDFMTGLAGHSPALAL